MTRPDEPRSASPPRSDDPMSKADGLVSFASLFANGMYDAHRKRFPNFAPLRDDKWIFFGTVAAVWCASGVLTYQLPESMRSAVLERIHTTMRAWHPAGLPAMEDLSQFVDDSLSGKERASADEMLVTVGTWMLWNVLGRCPTQSEYPVVSAIGLGLCQPFAHYWKAAA